ncbi:DUF4381 domain-containing protein [Photobacterium gaetbulicola]|uniref:DUF4381 domain-containing protein n=1 Tax=Photobacterium gaetbulicola TaxID=1295392 RepID=UPI00068BC20D|nr:DUF4381 domain-containing protein [Photobacterium gaetbulicola]
MSIEHTPPSTYILRELHDVVVPESVSWVPQTLGWKILLGVLLIIAGLLLVLRVLNWWNNRYRSEALAAITHLQLDDQNFEDSLYSILKIVLVYLDPGNGKLFGKSLLQQLDTLSGGTGAFDDDLGQRWTQSLVDPSTVLNLTERTRLQQKVVSWVKTHQGRHHHWVFKGGPIAKLVGRRCEQGERRHV